MKVQVEKYGKVVHAVIDDEIDKEFLGEMKATIERVANETGNVPSLVIEVKSFEGWDDFDDFRAHMNLVKQNQKLVGRIAIVSDKGYVKLLKPVASVFLKANVRRFEPADLQDALTWAAGEEPELGPNFEVIAGLPRDVIGLRIYHDLSSNDMEASIRPLIEGKKVEDIVFKILLVFPNDFKALSVLSAGDDLALGMKTAGNVGHIAIVTEDDSLRSAIKNVAAFTNTPIAVFDDEDVAIEWIKWA